MTKPLQADLAAIDASASKWERFWGYIPVLGWAVAHVMWNERVRPTVKSVENQLRSQPKPDSAVWGTKAGRVALALYVCSVAQKEMGWPNDHFIPEDPTEVAFWAHEDGLDVENAVMEIEVHLDIQLEVAEVEHWFTQTLGEVVDFLWQRCQKQQYFSTS